ncbi:MAG: ubiquitin carboxyl-terminal hydrolase family protein, partial [Chlamydiota bacterium]
LFQMICSSEPIKTAIKNWKTLTESSLTIFNFDPLIAPKDIPDVIVKAKQLAQMIEEYEIIQANSSIPQTTLDTEVLREFMQLVTPDSKHFAGSNQADPQEALQKLLPLIPSFVVLMNVTTSIGGLTVPPLFQLKISNELFNKTPTKKQFDTILTTGLTAARNSSKFQTSPPFLFLHVERLPELLKAKFPMPPEFTLPDALLTTPSQPKYTLKSVIKHEGPYANSGHYTAAVSVPTTTPPTHVYCNDNMVTVFPVPSIVPENSPTYEMFRDQGTLYYYELIPSTTTS